MKVIFLDIDGVLNYKGCKARCGYYIGVDGKKAQLLAQLVQRSGAKIVLVSTWKENWHTVLNKHKQDDLADYLDARLAEVDYISTTKQQMIVSVNILEEVKVSWNTCTSTM